MVVGVVSSPLMENWPTGIARGFKSAGYIYIYIATPTCENFKLFLIHVKVTVTGFDLTDYRQCLSKWSNSMKTMLHECDELGPSRCLKVKYEDLVLHPRSQMEIILKYLELPWMEDVLHHEQYINKPGGVSLSK